MNKLLIIEKNLNNKIIMMKKNKVKIYKIIVKIDNKI